MDTRKGKKSIAHYVPFVEYGICTHIGRREYNQDEALVPSAHRQSSGCRFLFAVADGMGGQMGGGIASRMACGRLKREYERKLSNKHENGLKNIRRNLVEAVIRIDRLIRFQGLNNSDLEDMGTTLSCLVIAGKQSVIAHVGDSRIYRLRKGRLNCLTVDHTFAQDMVFEGLVDPSQVHLHPLRHMLTRAVGAGEALEWVDTRTDRLQVNDLFLLCTDGLHNTLSEAEIADSLTREPDPAGAASELVTLAGKKGARDNMTAVVAKVSSFGNRFQDPIQ
jgi:protein phosphatase